jgi:hypothetical protein
MRNMKSKMGLKRARYKAARLAKPAKAAKKNAASARRDARMTAVVKAGPPPYTPDVMSWLSRKLDKPSSRITAEDVRKL